MKHLKTFENFNSVDEGIGSTIASFAKKNLGYKTKEEKFKDKKDKSRSDKSRSDKLRSGKSLSISSDTGSSVINSSKLSSLMVSCRDSQFPVSESEEI